MAPPTDEPSKGLATVALLKVNFDNGNDHLDMFLPFVLDAIRLHPTGQFGSSEIRADVISRSALEIPLPAVDTLLRRAVRRRFLRRDGDGYIRDPKQSEPPDILPRRRAIEREHVAVGQALMEFAAPRGLVVPTPDIALSLILRFLDHNQMTIILEPDPRNLWPTLVQYSHRDNLTVAKFLQHIFHAEPTLSEYVLRMVEGLVLQNALTLGDIDSARRRFLDLEVFFDTPFLFKAVGLSYPDGVAAARETLGLLRATNARIAVFEKTVEEMRRVLDACQRLLQTPSGIQRLYPTDLTRYLLTHHYQPSHVIQASSLLERNLKSLGLTIRAFPPRVPEFTLDERDLANRVRRPTETELEPRVTHDVDCVAAVLTLRAGRTVASLDYGRAVFATTTSLLVRNTIDWYRSQGETGTPPIIHQLGLSNIAWLKKPSVATNLKRHELVALCSAALQPTRRTWDALIRELQRLQQAKELSTDEAIAVVTSSITDERLSDVYDEDRIDSETVGDVLARVRAAYSEEAARNASEATRAASAEAMRQEGRRVAAEANAHRMEEDRRQMELRVLGIVDRASRVGAAAMFWIAAMIVGAGIFFGLPGMFPSERWPRYLAAAAIVVLAGLTFANQVWGFFLADWRGRVKFSIERRLQTLFLGRSYP